MRNLEEEKFALERVLVLMDVLHETFFRLEIDIETDEKGTFEWKYNTSLYISELNLLRERIVFDSNRTTPRPSRRSSDNVNEIVN